MKKPIQQQLKTISRIILFSMSCLFLHAQSPLVKQWDYRFGGTSDDQPASFVQTRDGGYVFGGWSNSGIGGDKTQTSWGFFDYWVVKIDSIGYMQWDKRFGGNFNDMLYSLQQTTDGGYILGGHSVSDRAEIKHNQGGGWMIIGL